MLTQEHRKALLIAWDVLAAGRKNYICTALESILIYHPRFAFEVLYLKNYIRASLGTHLTLEQWQISNGFGVRSADQLRKDRIAWIQWMLEEEIC